MRLTTVETIGVVLLATLCLVCSALAWLHGEQSATLGWFVACCASGLHLLR
jgi:hypothetical protein